MSVKSLNKVLGDNAVIVNGASADGSQQKPLRRSWLYALLLPVWVTVAFIASNLAYVLIDKVLRALGYSLDTLLRPAAENATVTVIIYVLTLLIVIGVPYLFRSRIKTTLSELGIPSPLSWTDIGLAPVVFIAYILASVTVTGIVISLFPAFPSDQVQDVGFKAFGSQMDNMIAFVTLVVCAPLAEEILFRGYLYGKLSRLIPRIGGDDAKKKRSKVLGWLVGNSASIVSAVIVSLLFAVAHMQLNVGLDVFVLSLFLCGLRGITGTIWAGVLVHMIKNGIAYYIMFVAPLFGIGG